MGEFMPSARNVAANSRPTAPTTKILSVEAPASSQLSSRRRECGIRLRGYRRACALVNRHRAAWGAPKVNAKRVYRVMAAADLLLRKAPRRRQSSRTHEGRVAVSRSELRWCSDGLEIKCDSGQTVTVTVARADRREADEDEDGYAATLKFALPPSKE